MNGKQKTNQLTQGQDYTNSKRMGLYLFERFIKIIPSYNKTCSPDDPQEAAYKMKEEIIKWTRVAEKLTNIQIERALDWFEKHAATWIPDTAKFLYKAHGLLDCNIAHEQAKIDHESFAVREAYTRISEFDRRSCYGDILRKKFIAHYNDVCEKIIEGKLKETPMFRKIEHDKIPGIVMMSRDDIRKDKEIDAAQQKFRKEHQQKINEGKRFKGTTIYS